MPRVFIPPLLKKITGPVDQVDIDGTTVRQIIENLELKFPGVKDRLCDGDSLKPGLAVAIDSHITNKGLFAKVPADSEVHFVTAIGGG